MFLFILYGLTYIFFNFFNPRYVPFKNTKSSFLKVEYFFVLFIVCSIFCFKILRFNFTSKHMFFMNSTAFFAERLFVPFRFKIFILLPYSIVYNVNLVASDYTLLYAICVIIIITLNYLLSY